MAAKRQAPQRPEGRQRETSRRGSGWTFGRGANRLSQKLGQRPTGMNPYNNPVPELSTVSSGELFKTPKTQRQVRSGRKR